MHHRYINVQAMYLSGKTRARKFFFIFFLIGELFLGVGEVRKDGLGQWEAGLEGVRPPSVHSRVNMRKTNTSREKQTAMSVRTPSVPWRRSSLRRSATSYFADFTRKLNLKLLNFKTKLVDLKPDVANQILRRKNNKSTYGSHREA